MERLAARAWIPFDEIDDALANFSRLLVLILCLFALFFSFDVGGMSSIFNLLGLTLSFTRSFALPRPFFSFRFFGGGSYGCW